MKLITNIPLYLFLLFCLLSLASAKVKTLELLYQDDFEGDLAEWVVEGGKVSIVDGRLDITAPKGSTVWFKQKLSGPILIEYNVEVIDEDGPYDRVSDLNCFWMATDPMNPDDLFANKNRNGEFKNYHTLVLYYVGYGGHNNSATRFRRYIGKKKRPLLPEHDLSKPEYLIKANTIIKIQLIANGDTIQHLRDGEVVFNFIDEAPYTEGWFGFRTVKNHMRIDDFKVYRIE